VKKIAAKLSALMRFRQGTRVLLVVFLILLISILFVGLDDLLGYILGYLATAVLFIMATRTWRSIRRFLALFFVSLIGIIFLSFFYVEVICRLAVMIGGAGALQGTPLDVVEMIITYVILFAGAVGMVFGILGTVILGILRLATLISHKGITENT